ncbi:MAG: DUF72 domain-containing protein [Dissulfurispiraceae bacterium]|jgi:uncharacterized protein YecE (DUF72 family)
MPKLHIGCSGFHFSDWKGAFYPSDLPQRKWLQYYCNIFDTVELNVTFYRLPLAKTFEAWHNVTPSNFIFSLKGSRYITHIRRLFNVEEAVRTFFDRALILEKKLHVVLWQFPPVFKADIARLEIFLQYLAQYPVRHTLEFRNESWLDIKVFDLCERYNVSLCMADWPAFLDDLPTTADFIYIRRHGENRNYESDYPKAALMSDTEQIKKHMTGGKDVFIYFNNDAHGYAAKNAKELIKLI